MTQRATSRGVTIPAALTALLLAAMWGSNVVGLKVTLEGFTPVWSAFWRMLLGLPTLALWAWIGGVSLRPSTRELRFLWILGGLFSLQIMLLNLSVNYTSAAYSAVLINASPIFTNVIAHFFVHEDRLSKLRIVGLALAFGGVCAVLLSRPETRFASAPVLGNILAMATAVAIAVRMVYTQKLVQKIDPIRTIFWQVVFSLPCFLVVAAVFEGPAVVELATRPVVAMLYCSFGVVGVAFILWVRLLKQYPPGLISVFVFPTPLFGVLFSALVYGERIGAELLLGVAAVATGILIVSWEKRTRIPR